MDFAYSQCWGPMACLVFCSRIAKMQIEWSYMENLLELRSSIAQRAHAEHAQTSQKLSQLWKGTKATTLSEVQLHIKT